MNNMKPHIDAKLKNIKVSNALKNEILQKAVSDSGKKQKNTSNKKFKTLIPVMCLITVMAVGFSAAAEIKHFFFESKEIQQGLEGETYVVSVDPSVKEPENSIPGYVIFIDSESFVSEKKDGIEKISGIANPQAFMTISHTADTTINEYIDSVISNTKSEILAKDLQITENSLGVKYTTGFKFDDTVTTVFAVDDGKGGCFILKYEHTFEASEGYGARFTAMAKTFEVITK